eukprot:scaffold13533_cov90-Skeletonema_dohrnii-CCMP3373.AAC.7
MMEYHAATICMEEVMLPRSSITTEETWLEREKQDATMQKIFNVVESYDYNKTLESLQHTSYEARAGGYCTYNLAHRLWAQALESGLEAEGLLGAHNDRI